jgi:hypothetical protein
MTRPSIGTYYEVWGENRPQRIAPIRCKTLEEARRVARQFDSAAIREQDGHFVEAYERSGRNNPKRKRGRSMKRRRAKKIRFRGHLWTRAKFAKKYGKRKAAKCFSKRTRKYSRRRRSNGRGLRARWYRGGAAEPMPISYFKRGRVTRAHRRAYKRKTRNGAYPYFTVIKGGGKRKKYRRPKLRLVKGGRRYRPAANCRR